MASIVVGPVIGAVTDSTARVLMELDTAATISCHLRPVDASMPSQTATATFHAHIPGVFKFKNLFQSTRYLVSFTQSEIKNAEDRTGSFKTMPTDPSNLTIISFSCNSIGETEKPVVWDDLIEKYIHTGKADLVLHVGDQVYADSAFSQGVKLAKHAGHNRTANNHMLKHEICNLYRDFYRHTWNYAPTRYVLAHVPNLMIWDDHDVRDDWGSHSADHDTNSDEYYVGLCARQVYWEYQRQLWDDILEREVADVKTECHFHKFGSIGILFVDNRGSRSFYRDHQRPFLSRVQWDAITHELFSDAGLYGPNSGTKALVVTMSTALVCAGPRMSHVGAGVMKDKMGWGLNPTEQIDFIKALHRWKMGSLDNDVDYGDTKRDLVVIGGDLHIAIRSEIRHHGKVLFEQLITSAIRQHAPPQVGQVAVKSLMNTSEKLREHYSFRHTFFKPRRNFGVLSVRVKEQQDTSCPSVSIQTHFFYRNKRGEPYKQHPKFDEGDLVISALSGKDLVAKDSNGLSDPYFKFKALWCLKRRSKPIMKTLNPAWGPEVQFRIPIAAFNYKHCEKYQEPAMLHLEVWDYDKSSADDFMGTVEIDLGPLLARVPTDNGEHAKPRELIIRDLPLASRSNKSDRVSGTVSMTLRFTPNQ